MQFFELFGGLHPSKEPFRAQNKPVSLPPTSRDILSRTSATPNLPIEGSFLGEGSKKKESLPASLRVPFFLGRTGGSSGNVISQKMKKAGPLDIYSPFRLLANFAAQDYNFNAINPLAYSGLNSHVNLNVNARAQETQGFFKEEFSKRELFKLFNNTLKQKGAFEDPLERVKKGKLFSVKGESLLGVKNKRSLETRSNGTDSHPKNNMSQLFTELGQKNFAQKINSQTNLFKTSEKALSQRSLRKEYVQEKTLNSYHISKINRGSLSSEEREEQTLNAKPFLQESLRDIGGSLSSSSPNEMNKKRDGGKLRKNPLNYLDFYSYNNSYTEFRNTQRGKQTERTLQEEEAKKVFVIINSFGGSVGNGITVHDALQFIKAGSLTLALGVAASAASLALAGGTIGERYVTEGCHVMIHQPESSIQGQASDIWIDSQEIMKIRLDVAEIYSLATYRPRHKILRDLDRDFYLTATETIHYGLADEIATNEVMHEIIEMTSKVWDYHDTKQQRLLESRDTSNSGLDTQSQN
jgi:ATP-dependent Clp protease protease subunit